MSTPAPLPKKGVAAPGYTQIPNEILEAMPKMKEAELRITLAIARKTFGWHKRKDKLSHSQLKDLTGLSKQGVQNGLDDALKRGFIDREPASRQQFFYFLVVNDVDQLEDKAVNLVDQTGQPSRPELVNVVGTQNKSKKTYQKKNGGGISSTATDNPSPVPSPTAAVTEKISTEQRPTATEIVTPILKELEAAKRQQAQEYQSNESAILKAFEALNQSIRAGRNPYNPITGTKQLAERLAARGETEATMKAAWDTCKANGIKPMGAFMKWIQDGYLPPQQEGQETKVFNGTIHVWTDDGGWTDTGRKAV